MSSEWIELFNAESLDGWSTTDDGNGWKVDNSTIHCSGESGDPLYTHGTFEDFDLDLEFKMAEDANSGIFFWISDLDDHINTGLEVQILDTQGKEPDKYACGALFQLVAPSTDAVKPAGEWNRLELTCNGSIIQESLNGERVVNVDIDRWSRPGENPDGTENKFEYAWADMARRGHIGLQDHGGRIWFRDVRLRER